MIGATNTAALLWKKWVPRRLGRSRSRRNKPGQITVTTWRGPRLELNRLSILLRLRNLPIRSGAANRRSRDPRRSRRRSLDDITHVHGFSRYGRPRRHTRHLRIQRFRVHLAPAASNIMRRTGCCCWAQTQLVERNHVPFFFAIPQLCNA